MSGAGSDEAPDDDALARRERDRISAVRMELLEHHPFWGHLLLSAELIAAPGLRAIAATDCARRVWYNPERTASLTHRELGFVLAHEIGHMAYQSHARIQGRHARLWNCATDFAINRIVAQIEDPSRPGERLYTPPARVLLDRRFDGMNAEVIYAYLERDAKARQAARRKAGEVSDDAETEPDLDDAGDHDGGVDVHVSASPDAADEEALSDRIKQAVAYWRRNGRRGDVPGGLERRYEAPRTATPPWLVQLRAHLDQTAAREELDPWRPSRKWRAHDLVLPGLGGERVPSIVIALDTSGSMSHAVIRQACAEIKAVTELAEQACVIVADARVHEVIGLDDVDRWLRRGRVTGGGGTSHIPVFDYIRAHRLNPTLMIGFTDLHSRFPARPPAFPVVWVTDRRHGPAPFGTVIEVGPEFRDTHTSARGERHDLTMDGVTAGLGPDPLRDAGLRTGRRAPDPRV